MTPAASPRSVRILGWLLLGIAVAGVMEATAGILELVHLDANQRKALLGATFPYDTARAISNLDGSGKMAIWVGGAGILALLAKYFILRADTRAQVVAWAVCAAFLVGQLALMGQDSSIGLTPYADPNNDQVQQDLINDLITAPGYFLLLYSAEVAGLVLGIWAAVLLRSEDTVEYLRRRTQAQSDPDWDAMMAARRKAVP